MAILSKKKQKDLIAKGYDLDFLKRVQPKGNLNFKTSDRFYYGGDGCYTILHVFGYPTDELEDFWMLDLMGIKGTRAFLSHYHEDNRMIKRKLNKSIEEKSTRISGNSKLTDNQTEIDDIQDLAQLHRKIEKQNITMLGMYIRIYVTAPTEELLFQNVEEIKERTSQFKMTILIGELDFEYRSAFIPPAKQEALPNSRPATIIPAEDFAGGYFFNHTKLEDQHGSYYGWTPTNGAINFNMLERSNLRTRSSMFISGNPKMGQRTFSLKLNDDLYAKGNYIRNFDDSGMFTRQTQYQHGLILNLSGSQNRINLFQVFPTVTAENGIDVDEIRSFEMHVEKLKNTLQMLNKSVTADDITTFSTVLSNFYVDYVGVWYRNPELHKEKLRITKIRKEECPVLSDFVNYITGVERQVTAKRNVNPIELQSIARIRKTFEGLFQSHGAIFEGTTEFKDISNEKVVTFDLSALKGQPDIFNAQLFSVLSLVSADILNNGKKCKIQMDQNPYLKEEDLPHYIVNIGAAQHVINPKYQRSVDLLADMMDSMNDNFGGMILSVNSLQGIIFENGANSHQDPYVTAVKKIFGLMQYRVFAQTSETDIPLLANALAGSMNQSELETLPTLSKGQLFMNIAGMGNLVFNQQLLPHEQQRYGDLR